MGQQSDDSHALVLVGRFGLHNLTRIWEIAADHTFHVMIEGGDPNAVEVFPSRPNERPRTLFLVLIAITERLCKTATPHNDRFRVETLWDFVATVDPQRWCCGYRTTGDYVQASAALLLAKTELSSLRTTLDESRTWIPAAEARRWALDRGVKVSLPTIGRAAKKRNEFKWRQGEGKTQYEVDLNSFTPWVFNWNAEQNAKRKKAGKS